MRYRSHDRETERRAKGRKNVFPEKEGGGWCAPSIRPSFLSSTAAVQSGNELSHGTGARDDRVSSDSSEKGTDEEW